VELLGGKYVKYIQNNNWGLMTLTKKTILPPRYDDISLLGNSIVFVREGKHGIISHASAMRTVRSGNSNFKTRYDEIEIISPERFLGIIGDKETILGPNGEELLPPEKHQIYSTGNYWYTKDKNGYFLLDSDFNKINDQAVVALEYNENYISLKTDTSYILIPSHERSFRPIQYDSIKIMGSSLVYCQNTDSAWVRMSDSLNIRIEQGDVPRAMGSNQSNAGEPQFVLILGQNNRVNVFAVDGTKGPSGWYSDIDWVGDSLFMVESRKKLGVINWKGEVIIPLQFDAVARSGENLFVILKNGKFGFCHTTNGFVSEAAYDARPVPYGDSLFIVRKYGNFGLLDWNGHQVLDQEFESIHPLNDSILVLTKQEEKQLWNYTSDSVYDFRFEYIENMDTDFPIWKYSEDGLKWGLFHLEKGLLTRGAFEEIKNVSTPADPVFMTEMYSNLKS
jgi:hypothetical protein